MLQFPRDRGWESLILTGTFETGTTTVLRRLLHPGAITFDVGANIGWYTTLFAVSAPRGHCHAFEPQPSVFEQLVVNSRMNGIDDKVTLNNVALADRAGTTTLYRFSRQPHGHASMAPTIGVSAQEITCNTTTLDQYRQEHSVERVDLIKVDVEGAELLVLKGAEGSISLECPPMWLLEINFETSGAFGYTPFDLLNFLAERDDFRFFRIVKGWGEIVPMNNVGDCAQADNVLCIPPEHMTRVGSIV